MTLTLSTILLGLAWFAAVNIVASVAIWYASRAVLRGRRRSLFGPLALRLMPAASALLVVWLLFLPGHLQFEPADANESFGGVLIVLALLALGLGARSACRLASVARASASLLRWAGTPARPAGVDVVEVPELPGVSLAGVFRTRILVGAAARAALSPAELEVAVAHEIAHRSSRDNLKRCAMFCAPDFFGWTAAARRLETEWRAEAECRADAHAVAGDENRAMHLASALVKMARITAPVTSLRHSPVWSTFHDAPLFETRVRRLVSATTAPAEDRPVCLSGGLLLVAALPLVLWLAGAPYQLHRLTERLITLLP